MKPTIKNFAEKVYQETQKRLEDKPFTIEDLKKAEDRARQHKKDLMGNGVFSEQFEFDFGEPQQDQVNHPVHYTSHPSGVECIEITRYMNFCLGNALKYIWRADLKGDSVTDLKKAIFYINEEIALREENENAKI